MNPAGIEAEDAARRFWSGPALQFSAAERLESFYPRRVERILSLLRERTQALRALDLGCGSGLLAEALARWGIRVTAVDLSAHQVERARERCRSLEVEVRLGDLDALAKDERFDIVCAIGVLPYVHGQSAFVSRLCERVTPGGQLIVSRTRSVTPFVWLEAARQLRESYFDKHSRRIALNLLRTGIWSGGFITRGRQRRLSQRQLDRLLSERGFSPAGGFGLFNLERLDERLGRSRPILDFLARRSGWCVVTAYRRR
jgi:SAM-dependent methyltransferase